MPYYLIIAFQAFCMYHLFKNRNNYYWIFAIVFLPVIGCIIYLFTEVINKSNTDKIQESLVTVINPTKKIKDLELKLKFAETYLNTVNLADAYYASGDFEKAIALYKKALEDTSQNEFHVKKQLIKSYSYKEEYSEVVNHCQLLKDQREFLKSELPFVYGLALEQLGRMEEAEIQLRKMDQPYSHYNERLGLIQFLTRTNKVEEAREILNELHNETQLMTKANRRNNRLAIVEIDKLKTSI